MYDSIKYGLILKQAYFSSQKLFILKHSTSIYQCLILWYGSVVRNPAKAIGDVRKSIQS